jgi:hypothetical protein
MIVVKLTFTMDTFTGITEIQRKAPLFNAFADHRNTEQI